MPITSLVARYDHILLDLDGCVWVGDEPTRGAVDAIAALRAAGKNVAFVTNDSQLATEEYVRKLWRLGFQASLEEVVTVGGALQFLLAERFQGRAAVVIGSEALHRHVEAAGLRIVNGTAFASRAEVVVVACHPDSTTPSCATRRRRRCAGRRSSAPAATRRSRGRRAVAGLGLDHRGGRNRVGVHRARRRQAGAARSSRPRSTGSARGRALDGRRPRRRRPGRGERRRHRRRDRPDRSVDARDRGGGEDPGPVAIAERLETLVLGT